MTFSIEGDNGGGGGEALAVFRTGRLLGSDKFGAVFEGQLGSTQCGGASILAMSVRVPPGGVLVTGQRCGAEEVVLDVVGMLAHTDGEMSGVCDLFGQRLSVRFCFVGSLPV